MRQLRWLKLIKGYDYDIMYHLSKANMKVDVFKRKMYLSQIPTQKEIQVEFDKKQTLAKLEIKLTLFEKVSEEQTFNEWCNQVNQRVNKGLKLNFQVVDKVLRF